MNIKQILKFIEEVLNESPMYQNPRKDFTLFYKYVTTNPKAKKTYFLLNDELKIPSDTILHVEKKHKLDIEQWNFFFQNYKNFDYQNSGKLIRYDGNPIKYMFTYNKRTFGYVIEYFDNKLPILTTCFEDYIGNIKEWINQ